MRNNAGDSFFCHRSLGNAFTRTLCCHLANRMASDRVGRENPCFANVNVNKVDILTES